MGDEQLLTGIYVDNIRECAWAMAERIPGPWDSFHVQKYLKVCGPDTIIKLCNEIEGLRRMLNAQEDK